MKRCWFIREPSVAVVYIHVPRDAEHVELAKRFVAKYLENPSGYDHATIIVCNGGQPTMEMSRLFFQLPRCSFFLHDDSGWDIGGYIAVSRTIQTDAAMYFCGTGFVQHPGWLARMVAAWNKFGPGMYGTLATYEVSPHLNTTGFLAPPLLVANYPITVRDKRGRYDFEHGPHALWKIARQHGIPVKLVTWDGEYDWPDWRKPANIYRRGDQSNCVTFFRHSLNFALADPNSKRFMSSLADRMADPAFK